MTVDIEHVQSEISKEFRYTKIYQFFALVGGNAINF